MVAMAHSARCEVSLFARPNAGWDASATARAPGGAVVAPASRGQEQFVWALRGREARGRPRRPIRADRRSRAAGGLRRDANRRRAPASMQAKVSVMLPVSNAGAARVVAGLGANTINVTADLSLAQLAAIRAAVDVPVDVYVEVPDDLGGFVRLYEIPEIVRVCSPVYVKFGLRNAPDVYPAGSHLDSLTVGLSRERVRRARLGLDLLERYAPHAVMSDSGRLISRFRNYQFGQLNLSSGASPNPPPPPPPNPPSRTKAGRAPSRSRRRGRRSTSRRRRSPGCLPRDPVQGVTVVVASASPRCAASSARGGTERDPVDERPFPQFARRGRCLREAPELLG